MDGVWNVNGLEVADLVGGYNPVRLDSDVFGVDEGSQQLFKEQGVALGPTEDQVAGRGWKVVDLQEFIDELLSVSPRKWTKRDHDPFRVCAVHKVLMERGCGSVTRSVDRHEKQRCQGSDRYERIEHSEGRGIGPVQVLPYQYQRSGVCGRLDHRGECRDGSRSEDISRVLKPVDRPGSIRLKGELNQVGEERPLCLGVGGPHRSGEVARQSSGHVIHGSVGWDSEKIADQVVHHRIRCIGGIRQRTALGPGRGYRRRCLHICDEATLSDASVRYDPDHPTVALNQSVQESV